MPQNGGLISLTGTGTITLINGALIDVTGDSAGTIQLTTDGDVSIQGGGNIAIRGVGDSATADEGERFADGGALEIISNTGNITLNGEVFFAGDNQAAGGIVDLRAARNITVQPGRGHVRRWGRWRRVHRAAGDNITILKTSIPTATPARASAGR